MIRLLSVVVTALAVMVPMPSLAASILDDTRFCGPPERNADGSIMRSRKVLRQFETIHPRPQDGRRWYIDHPLPLACGGCDSVVNLQWLPEEQWRAKSAWERKVYGGRGISPGCP